MSWIRSMLLRRWPAETMEKMEREIEARTRARREAEPAAAPISPEARIDELERDLGRVVLLARALVQALLRKGLLTQNEIGDMMAEVDLSDGVADGAITKWRRTDKA